MPRYTYSGPVMSFGKCIARNWKGATFATTSRKAVANLQHQYRKQNGLEVNVPIDFTQRLFIDYTERKDIYERPKEDPRGTSET